MAKEQLSQAEEWEQAAQHRIIKTFRSWDENRDGQISYAEFVAWLFGQAYRELPVDASKKLWYKDTLKDALHAVPRRKPFGTPRSSTLMEMKAKNLILRDQVITVDSVD